MTTQTALPPEYTEGLAREWQHLAAPGTWWKGAERLAIARVARAARSGDAIPEVDLPAPAIEAVTRLSRDAHADAAWVARLEAEDLTAEAYVEILGIVARLVAVDSFLFGIGAEPMAFPTAVGGEPSRQRVAEASINGGYVPTVGEAWAPNALSAVTAETDALLELHGVLYLSIKEMGDLEIKKSLNRPQMEFVASRTSYLNDCFF